MRRRGGKRLRARARNEIYNTRRGWAGDFHNGKELAGWPREKIDGPMAVVMEDLDDQSLLPSLLVVAHRLCRVSSPSRPAHRSVDVWRVGVERECARFFCTSERMNGRHRERAVLKCTDTDERRLVCIICDG